MTKYRDLKAVWLTLASVLALTAVPAAAQEEIVDREPGVREAAQLRGPGSNNGGGRWAPRGGRDNGGGRSVATTASAPEAASPRAGWGNAERGRGGSERGGFERRGARSGTPAVTEAPAPAGSYGADRNTSYTAPRDRSYGANARAGWAQRQSRDAAGQQQRSSGTWAATGDRWSRPDGARNDARSDARGSSWQGNRDRSDARNTTRSNDWQRDRREDARRAEWRDDSRNYANGYRDGRRDDNRYGQDHRRWDNRGWRNDNRYDWYRYRSANRSLFSLGRYYAPYRGYSYSRLSIGVRLGSPFYSNRYWINDPWRYRLPDVYGPYRWVRYYDDALLVDVYSGEVVDVIHNFFW